MAFVVDPYGRRNLGWRTSTSMTADLVLGALEQAIWTRQHEDRADLTALVAQHARGVQYVPVAPHPASRRRRQPAVGSSAESINRFYKTEVIRRRGPWRTVDAVEIATAEWVDWYNCETSRVHCRLSRVCRRHATRGARDRPLRSPTPPSRRLRGVQQSSLRTCRGGSPAVDTARAWLAPQLAFAPGPGSPLNPGDRSHRSCGGRTSSAQRRRRPEPAPNPSAYEGRHTITPLSGRTPSP